MKEICLLILMVTLTGCTTVGTPIKDTNVSAIQRGVTTKQEILGMFGTPIDTAMTPAGLTYTYQFTKSSPTPVDIIPVVSLLYVQLKENQQTLLVNFDNNDIVKDYSFTKTARVLSSIPSSEQKEAAAQAQAEATQPTAQFNASYEGTYRATVRVLVNDGYTIRNSDSTAGSITAKGTSCNGASPEGCADDLSALITKINDNLTEVEIIGNMNHKILFDKIGVVLSGRQ
jgi:outer membrane protein assembly factor BamE (lipoprotein component of BamABCDE complex)